MADIIGAVPDLPPLQSYSQDAILGLFSRILPSYYLDPLKAPGPGYELLQAYAAIAARVSEAIKHIGDGNYIATAQGGSYAVGYVYFTRPTTIWGAFTLLPGTLIGTATGYQYVTTTPVSFTATSTFSAPVLVRATVRSWLYNQPGPVTLEDGTEIQGPVDRLVQPVLPSGGNFDPTLRVFQTTAMFGGASPMLDGLGNERGLERADGESDADYRLRQAVLPLTVTPSALRRQAAQILDPALQSLGLRWWMYEGWDLRVQACWDAPKNQTWTDAEQYATVPAYNANIFVWDYEPETTDAYQPGGWTNRMMDAIDYRRAIVIGLPNESSLYGLYASLAQNIEQAKPAGVPIYYLVA